MASLECDDTIFWPHGIVMLLYFDVIILWHHYIVPSLYHGVIVSWRHCIMTSLYHDVIMLWWQRIVTSQQCDVIMLLRHCIVASSRRDIIASWRHCIMESLHHDIIALSLSGDFQLNCCLTRGVALWSTRNRKNIISKSLCCTNQGKIKMEFLSPLCYTEFEFKPEIMHYITKFYYCQTFNQWY